MLRRMISVSGLPAFYEARPLMQSATRAHTLPSTSSVGTVTATTGLRSFCTASPPLLASSRAQAKSPSRHRPSPTPQIRASTNSGRLRKNDVSPSTTARPLKRDTKRRGRSTEKNSETPTSARVERSTSVEDTLPNVSTPSDRSISNPPGHPPTRATEGPLPESSEANFFYAVEAPSALRTVTRDEPSASSVRRIVPPVYQMPFPQERFVTFHPNRSEESTAQSPSPVPAATTPLRDAYERDGPTAIWRAMRGEDTAQKITSTPGTSGPPEWFENVCRDLFFRTEDGKPPSNDGDEKRPTPASSADHAAEEGSRKSSRDPMLHVDFVLRDETAYTVGPYAFPPTMSSIWGNDRDTAVRLCAGDVNREYVCFAEGYRFPDRRQLPTSEGTEPLRLYVDPAAASRSTDPTVYIQLSADFPPAMWLPVRAHAGAIRRVVSEFASSASAHCELYHDHFRWRWHRAERQLVQQNMKRDPGDVLRMMGHLAGEVTFGETPIQEFSNSQEFFLGEFDDPERLVEHFDLSPYLFSIPLMRTRVDVHNPQYVPRIDGPGLALSLYRCVFSKALLLVQVHLSCEVKLPPQDPEAFHFLWKDAQQLPQSRIPVFVRVVWPDNERMCGGGKLLRRFNEWFSTEFSPDIPIDAAMAVFTTQRWARQLGSELKGVLGMRRRLKELEEAAGRPQPPLLYPSTREIPNPEYTADERVAMHIQYLAHLGDPEIRTHMARIQETCDSAAVRMGCAKAALEIGDRELFRSLVASEPPGRMQTYMTKLVRKRKSRDLVDAEPRLLDDQYEFPAPLWTNRKGRLDPTTAEGALLTHRLK